MDIATAKKFLTHLLDGDNPYVNLDNTFGIILEFIGGEPFLAVDLIDEITGWFLDEMLARNHPWLEFFRISISSNGLAYFTDKVQNYLNKYGRYVSLGISVDGHKELHDRCRVRPDGSGSYDVAIAAAKDWAKRSGQDLQTKATIAPSNVNEVSTALKSFYENGYTDVFMNCVFEEGWTNEHAAILYRELIKCADFLLENERYDELYFSMFDENGFRPQSEEENSNYCGGTGDMIAVDYHGDIYPCQRYMENACPTDGKAMIIGTVDDGIMVTPEQRRVVECLECITRRSQSTDECFYCPIGTGCAWCSAENYEAFGTADHRATFICPMHKARALANHYFWNKYYAAAGLDEVKELYVPEEWALEIISKEEFEMLKNLTN